MLAASLQELVAGESLVKGGYCGESAVLDTMNGLMAIPGMSCCPRLTVQI